MTSYDIQSMSFRLLCIAALAVLLSVSDAAAQGIPVTNAQMRAQAGWDALREGRHQDAADAFAAALAVAPRDPTLHVGAGLASYLIGQIATAQQSLERALVLSPSFTAASLLLGDILHRNNEVDAAIRVFEAALEYAPGDKTLASRLQRARQESELHSGFFQSQGAHFTVLFEGPSDEELSRRVLDVLEAAYWRVGTALLTFPERIIPVVLYTEQQFRDITRSPGWAAAAYDGRIRVPVRGALTNPDELDRVLTHEFTHALVQSVAPRGVPTWLNEGLAVVFEPRGPAWVDAQLGSSRDRLPLQRLADGFERLSGAQARIAYAQSGGAVRALIEQAGAPAMVALLQDIGRGDAFEAAFERRMMTTYASFAASLDPSR
ncbi:MAG TPA: tetratricopeptide repeat protein [Vicinamibacterales bacterium]